MLASPMGGGMAASPASRLSSLTEGENRVATVHHMHLALVGGLVHGLLRVHMLVGAMRI